LAKFATFFTLKPETVAAFLAKPSDRAAAVRKLVEPLGGKLESYYWMLGEHDGFIVVDLPDSVSAAAVSLAVGSTGAIAHLETHELFTSDQLAGLAEKANKARGNYRPPGA
jgi:uncharacterized protein with GYD domain